MNRIFLLLVLICLTAQTAWSTEAPHLVSYKRKEIIKHLAKLGYPVENGDEIYLRRNSTGSGLYISMFHYNGRTKRRECKMLSISLNGQITTLITPNNNREHMGWVNDTGEFVAWPDSGVIRFRNGQFRPWPRLYFNRDYFRIDPSGQYFFYNQISRGETGVLKHYTEIASIDKPNEPLAILNSDPQAIFFRNNKVYLFSCNSTSVGALGDGEVDGVQCQILTSNGSQFILEDEIFIPRPRGVASLNVVDMDPWSGNVLLIEQVDLPTSFMSAWYRLDLENKKIGKISLANDFGIFLQDDVLKIAVQLFKAADKLTSNRATK